MSRSVPAHHNYTYRCAGEYLFAPYSVFTLLSVEWSDKNSAPHKLVLEAAVDNRLEEETLPLAPWY